MTVQRTRHSLNPRFTLHTPLPPCIVPALARTYHTASTPTTHGSHSTVQKRIHLPSQDTCGYYDYDKLTLTHSPLSTQLETERKAAVLRVRGTVAGFSP